MTKEADTQDEIFIVEDDPAVCSTLSIVLSREGYRPICFAEGASLLAVLRTRTPACILIDVNIPGRSGLDILKELGAIDYPAPMIVISGQGNIPMAVDAIKSGAFDFIEKPFRGNAVAQRVREVIEGRRQQQGEASKAEAVSLFFPGREPLTLREREVLSQIVAGASSKIAGRELGISPRTVEVHRSRIMEKLGAKNVADLIRIAMSEGRRT